MQAPRSHLLLSCGKSFLAMAQKAYQRVEKMGGLVGGLARGVSGMASPILSPLQPRCLSALSFVDRQLAAVQDAATVVFPRSEAVLRKVDELVVLTESLPVRFDGAIDGLEGLVASVKSGVITALAPKHRVDDVVLRDIRCYDEEEGAVRRRAAGGGEDADRKREIGFEVVVVEVGGAGDGTVGPTEKTIGEDTEHTDDDVAQGAYEKATHPEAEEAEASSEVSGGTCKAESAGEGKQMTCVVASGVETNTDAAVQSVEIVSVESQEISCHGGEASEMAESSVSESGNQSNGDALLDLFDLAWQQKLA